MTQEIATTTQKIVITTFSSITAALLLLLYWLIPQFSLTFKSFGANLPLLTKIFLVLIPVYIPLAILSMAPILIINFGKVDFNKPKFLVKFTVILALLSIALVIVAMYAMYLPIFNLGNT